MCWYTMLGVPDLATFNEPCDNHANCFDEYIDTFGHNRDPRADDTKPYACALYSFCPDHCCPVKHIWLIKDCYQSQSNPCYAENQPGDPLQISTSREKLIHILYFTSSTIRLYITRGNCSVITSIKKR